MKKKTMLMAAAGVPFAAAGMMAQDAHAQETTVVVAKEKSEDKVPAHPTKEQVNDASLDAKDAKRLSDEAKAKETEAKEAFAKAKDQAGNVDGVSKDEAKEALDAAKADHAEAKKEVDQRTGEKEAKQKSLSDLDKEIAKDEKDLSDAKEVLKDNSEAKEAERDSNLKQAEADQKTAQSDLSNAKADETKKASEEAEKKASLDKSKSEKEVAEKVVSDADAKQKEAAAKVDSLTSDQKKADADVSTKEEAKNQADTKLADAEKEVEKAKADDQDLASRIDAKREEVNKAKSDASDKKAALDKENTSLASVSESLAKAKEALEKVKAPDHSKPYYKLTEEEIAKVKKYFEDYTYHVSAGLIHDAYIPDKEFSKSDAAKEVSEIFFKFYRDQHYVPTEKDKNHKISDPKNPTAEEEAEVSKFGIAVINGFREQLGYKPLKYSPKTQREVADVIRKLTYERIAADPNHPMGHERNTGTPSHAEILSSGGTDKTMAEQKNSVFDAIFSFLLMYYRDTAHAEMMLQLNYGAWFVVGENPWKEGRGTASPRTALDFGDGGNDEVVSDAIEVPSFNPEKMIEAAQKEVDEAQKAYDAAKSKLDEAQKAYDAANQKLTAAQDELSALEAGESPLVIANRKLDAAKAAEEKAADALAKAKKTQSDVADALSKARGALDDANDDLGNKKAVLAGAEMALSEAQTAYDASVSAHKDATAKVVALQDKIATLTKNIAGIKAEIASIEAAKEKEKKAEASLNQRRPMRITLSDGIAKDEAALTALNASLLEKEKELEGANNLYNYFLAKEAAEISESDSAAAREAYLAAQEYYLTALARYLADHANAEITPEGLIREKEVIVSPENDKNGRLPSGVAGQGAGAGSGAVQIAGQAGSSKDAEMGDKKIAPKTADVSMLGLFASFLSASGIALLARKRREE